MPTVTIRAQIHLAAHATLLQRLIQLGRSFGFTFILVSIKAECGADLVRLACLSHIIPQSWKEICPRLAGITGSAILGKRHQSRLPVISQPSLEKLPLFAAWLRLLCVY